MFHLISKARVLFNQTREGVFHSISNTEKLCNIKHENECFIGYPNPEYYSIKYPGVKYETREWVFHLITKHRELFYQVRDGVFYLTSNHREVIYQTHEWVLHLISKHKKAPNTNLISRHLDISNARSSMSVVI